MTEVSDEFKNQSLNDISFKYDLQRQADSATVRREDHQWEVESKKRSADNHLSMQNSRQRQTSALMDTSSFINNMINHDPTLQKQAEAYLDKLFSRPIESRKPETIERKDVDLDGSKKTLWGRLKNKAHNFLKPFNHKRVLEEYISKLEYDMALNPEKYNELRQQSFEKGKGFSFEGIVSTNRDIIESHHDQYSQLLYESQKLQEKDQEYLKAEQEAKAQVEARLEVRDNAAKEIELRSAAREGIGIKDINANSGVDKLADRAKAMEGMTPQQRLAFRMKELRGTKKETAQPVVKRELDSNIMSQKLNNQRQ
mgnify:CR=1 FL=1